jgi:hypothetical protein
MQDMPEAKAHALEIFPYLKEYIAELKGRQKIPT